MVSLNKVFSFACAVYLLTTSNAYAICSNRLPGVCHTWDGSQSSCKLYYEDHNGKHYKCKWQDKYNTCDRDNNACSS